MKPWAENHKFREREYVQEQHLLQHQAGYISEIYEPARRLCDQVTALGSSISIKLMLLSVVQSHRSKAGTKNVGS